MNLVTWDPFRDLDLLQGDMNRLFERFTGTEGRHGRTPWMPAMDIAEHEDHFLVHVDLPGLTEHDVVIEMEDRTLRISGERDDATQSQSDGYVRRERTYGRFERALTLPEGVNADAIRASFDNGVLALHVPKPQQAQPRRIKIGAGANDGSRTIEGHETSESDARSKRSFKDRVLSNA